MKNTPLRIVAGLAVIGVVFYLLNSYIYSEKQATYVVGETVERVGVILAVDTEKVALDGPVLLTLQSKDGGVTTIAVPSMGLPLCPAYLAKNIGDVYLIKPGQEFEVKGVIGEDGSVVPCESADHYLRPTPLIVENFEGEADPTRMTLTMQTWKWISALYNDGKKIEPKQPGKFMLTFTQDGKYQLATDCNSMGGSYTVGADKTLTFGDGYSTKMYCAGSQEDEFAGLLQNTANYHFTSKGELILGLKFDSGSVTLR